MAPTAPANPAASTPAQSDPVAAANALVNQVMGSSDKNAAFNQILSASPEAQQVMQWIQQYGNGDPKAGMLNWAAANGRSALAQELIQKFGLK